MNLNYLGTHSRWAHNQLSPHNQHAWAGNKAAMWGTADPHTGVQIPPRPFTFSEFYLGELKFESN
jgi:hypothetical protein